ncbi:MAG: hypothetical protein LBU24_05935 [Methanocalculaceae archaeon]|jgi:hypothetical protein|nr:hypothetical protein [Methanocalculaceae archaeon]
MFTHDSFEWSINKILHANPATHNDKGMRAQKEISGVVLEFSDDNEHKKFISMVNNRKEIFVRKFKK